MAAHHHLPPGVEGAARGRLTLAVDEVVWLHGSGGAQVLAEWWGSARVEQLVFGPVDVRSFGGQGGGGLPLEHSYPVHTSREKLEQYLKDASPLPLVLLDRQGGAAGRAMVGLEATGTEGYFPVWSDKQGREVANLHVKVVYKEGEEEEEQEEVRSNVAPAEGRKVLRRRNVKSPVKSRRPLKKAVGGEATSSEDISRQGEERRRGPRVTFSEGEAPMPATFPPSLTTPIADSLIADLLNQSATLRANMREQLAEAELGLEVDIGKENLPPGEAPPEALAPCPLPPSLPAAAAAPVPWNLSVARLKQLARVRSLTTTVLSVTVDKDLLTRLRRPAANKPTFTVGGQRASSGGRLPSLAFFVKFRLPGGQEASLCSRKMAGEGRLEFGESEVAQVQCSPALLDQWWTSSLDFSLHCRTLGQRAPLLLGSASLGLKHVLDSGASLGPGLTLALPVYAAQGLARTIGGATTLAREIIANVSVCLRLGVVESSKAKQAAPLSPRKAEREGEAPPEPRPPPATLHSAPSALAVSRPVMVLLAARPGGHLPDGCSLRHRTWRGREVRGEVLRCREVVLAPGREATAANKQVLSRLLENYLVVEVWRASALLGLARIPSSPLHQGLSAGEPPQLVVASEGLVEVVGLQDGEVLGLLEVGLWAGTEEQLKEVEGRGQLVDRQTMTDEMESVVEVIPETQKEVVVEIIEELVDRESREVTTDGYDAPASDTECGDMSQDETVRQVLEVEGEVGGRSATLGLRVVVGEGRNLPPSAALYCTLPGLTTALAAADTSDPVWQAEATIEVEAGLVTDPRRHLILKVWSCRCERPDRERDQMVGFAAVDLAPLVALPTLAGWYNVIDWVGGCRGQVSLQVAPLGEVPRLGAWEVGQGGGEARYHVEGSYSSYPSHLVAHTEQMIRASPPPHTPPPASTPLPPATGHTQPQFNFLPDDPTTSFLENTLARNLADLDALARHLAKGLLVDQARDKATSVSEKSANDTTFVVEAPAEEELETGRSLASISLMASTVEENLAAIRGLAAGEGCSAGEGRVEPRPAHLPDLGLVLADLGLDLGELHPQVGWTMKYCDVYGH